MWWRAAYCTLHSVHSIKWWLQLKSCVHICFQDRVDTVWVALRIFSKNFWNENFIQTYSEIFHKRRRNYHHRPVMSVAFENAILAFQPMCTFIFIKSCIWSAIFINSPYLNCVRHVKTVSSVCFQLRTSHLKHHQHEISIGRRVSTWLNKLHLNFAHISKWIINIRLWKHEWIFVVWHGKSRVEMRFTNNGTDHESR